MVLLHMRQQSTQIQIKWMYANIDNNTAFNNCKTITVYVAIKSHVLYKAELILLVNLTTLYMLYKPIDEIQI